MASTTETTTSITNEAAPVVTNESAVETSSQPQVAKPFEDGEAEKTALPAKVPAERPTEEGKAPVAAKKPLAPATTITPTTPTTPIKRPVEVINSATPEVKKAKVTATPFTPTAPTIVSRMPPGTPSPRPVSIERKVAEQRKKLEALLQKRLETAKKQEELDKQMAPYKRRMAEELERINREMMEEEEAAVAEDEEHLKASAEMYEEFKSADGGD